MPFINVRLSKEINSQQKQTIQREIEKVISEELNKPTEYIMVAIDHPEELWLGDNKLENGAMISVQHMGATDKNAYASISKRLTDNLSSILNTKGSDIYTTFQCINEWAWNGTLL